MKLPMQICIQTRLPPQSFGHDTLVPRTVTAARIKITTQYFIVPSPSAKVNNSNLRVLIPCQTLQQVAGSNVLLIVTRLFRFL